MTTGGGLSLYKPLLLVAHKIWGIAFQSYVQECKIEIEEIIINLHTIHVLQCPQSAVEQSTTVELLQRGKLMS